MKEHRAHAIGMSGLLVKSTVVMRENLEEMSRQGLEVPVLLGGAALTRTTSRTTARAPMPAAASPMRAMRSTGCI